LAILEQNKTYILYLLPLFKTRSRATVKRQSFFYWVYIPSFCFFRIFDTVVMLGYVDINFILVPN